MQRASRLIMKYCGGHWQTTAGRPSRPRAYERRACVTPRNLPYGPESRTRAQPPVRTNCNPTTYSLTSSIVPLFENAPLSPPLLRRRRAPLPSRKQLFAPTSCPNTSRPEIPDQPGIIAGLATYPSPIYLFFRLAITKKPSLPFSFPSATSHATNNKTRYACPCPATGDLNGAANYRTVPSRLIRIVA